MKAANILFIVIMSILVGIGIVALWDGKNPLAGEFNPTDWVWVMLVTIFNTGSIGFANWSQSKPDEKDEQK